MAAPEAQPALPAPRTRESYTLQETNELKRRWRETLVKNVKSNEQNRARRRLLTCSERSVGLLYTPPGAAQIKDNATFERLVHNTWHILNRWVIEQDHKEREDEKVIQRLFTDPNVNWENVNALLEAHPDFGEVAIPAGGFLPVLPGFSDRDIQLFFEFMGGKRQAAEEKALEERRTVIRATIDQLKKNRPPGDPAIIARLTDLLRQRDVAHVISEFSSIVAQLDVQAHEAASSILVQNLPNELKSPADIQQAEDVVQNAEDLSVAQKESLESKIRDRNEELANNFPDENDIEIDGEDSKAIEQDEADHEDFQLETRPRLLTPLQQPGLNVISDEEEEKKHEPARSKPARVDDVVDHERHDEEDVPNSNLAIKDMIWTEVHTGANAAEANANDKLSVDALSRFLVNLQMAKPEQVKHVLNRMRDLFVMFAPPTRKTAALVEQPRVEMFVLRVPYGGPVVLVTIDARRRRGEIQTKSRLKAVERGLDAIDNLLYSD